MFSAFLPNNGRYSAASFIGDFDYRAGSRSPRRGKSAATAAFAANVVFELMLAIGVDRINRGHGPKWRNTLMWSGSREGLLVLT